MTNNSAPSALPKIWSLPLSPKKVSRPENAPSYKSSPLLPKAVPPESPATHPGKSAPAILVKLWSESKDHEFNMRQEWTQTGVGAVVDSDGTVYSTQIFATVANFQMTTRNRFNSF